MDLRFVLNANDVLNISDIVNSSNDDLNVQYQLSRYIELLSYERIVNFNNHSEVSNVN